VAGRHELFLDAGELLGADEVIRFVENEARPIAADFIKAAAD